MIDEKNNLSGAFEKSEKLKYLKAWDFNNRVYAEYSPGLELSNSLKFLEFFKQKDVRTILDAGCGSGKLLKKMLEMGFQCQGVDIAENCLEPDLKPFQEQILKIGSLWNKEIFGENQFDAVVCTDVLEHIPSEFVEEVLQNIYYWANKYVFLQIALFEDYFGDKIEQRLHLTVRPKKWWDKQLQRFGYKILACSKNDKDEEFYAIYLLEKINHSNCLSPTAQQTEFHKELKHIRKDKETITAYRGNI